MRAFDQARQDALASAAQQRHDMQLVMTRNEHTTGAIVLERYTCRHCGDDLVVKLDRGVLDRAVSIGSALVQRCRRG